jgi:hypothetical protein
MPEKFKYEFHIAETKILGANAVIIQGKIRITHLIFTAFDMVNTQIWLLSAYYKRAFNVILISKLDADTQMFKRTFGTVNVVASDLHPWTDGCQSLDGTRNPSPRYLWEIVA